MCSWVGGFGFGLVIGSIITNFQIRIAYGVYEKVSDQIRLQNFHIRAPLGDDRGIGLTFYVKRTFLAIARPNT